MLVLFPGFEPSDLEAACDSSDDLEQPGPRRASESAARASRPWERAGLLMDSVIMADNLATIHESETDQDIGHLPHIAKLDRALRKTLAL